MNECNFLYFEAEFSVPCNLTVVRDYCHLANRTSKRLCHSSGTNVKLLESTSERLL